MSVPRESSHRRAATRNRQPFRSLPLLHHLPAQHHVPRPPKGIDLADTSAHRPPPRPTLTFPRSPCSAASSSHSSLSYVPLLRQPHPRHRLPRTGRCGRGSATTTDTVSNRSLLSPVYSAQSLLLKALAATPSPPPPCCPRAPSTLPSPIPASPPEDCSRATATVDHAPPPPPQSLTTTAGATPPPAPPPQPPTPPPPDARRFFSLVLPVRVRRRGGASPALATAAVSPCRGTSWVCRNRQINRAADSQEPRVRGDRTARRNTGGSGKKREGRRRQLDCLPVPDGRFSSPPMNLPRASSLPSVPTLGRYLSFHRWRHSDVH